MRAEPLHPYGARMTPHEYGSHVAWQGSTGAGYREYSRDHVAVARPAEQKVLLSADQSFRGDPRLLNPEQLLVVAASSCQLLSFLAVASRARVDVRGYDDDATAVLDLAAVPARITEVVLRPVVRVAPGTDHEQVRRLAAAAHEGCYVASSLTCTVRVDVTVVDA